MLLALILIFFVGKAFYEFAERHNESRCGFAIVGVGTYYAGIFASWFVSHTQFSIEVNLVSGVYREWHSFFGANSL